MRVSTAVCRTFGPISASSSSSTYRDSKREKIERRQALAKRLGITMNALAIRASRIRATLEAGVTACHEEEEKE